MRVKLYDDKAVGDELFGVAGVDEGLEAGFRHEKKEEGIDPSRGLLLKFKATEVGYGDA